MDASLLTLDAETMRRLGHAVVDLLVERSADTGGPPIVRATRAEMEERLREPPPEAAQPIEAILGQLREDILPFALRMDHPRNFAYIPSSGTWPGVLGDFIASACNLNAIFWKVCAGASQAEVVVLDWFKEWIGYPPQASGVLVSGGSAANLTAVACAREALLGAMSDRVVAYVSDQAHSSLARAARVLGFRPEQVRVLPGDERYRLRPEVLERAMLADERVGREPLLVAASAGTTNTGAIDPLAELAAVCREHGVWLHVDGAYGAFAALTERGRAALAGIELADSITLDPHKWLYQPYECGCLLVRDGATLVKAFHISPDYLKDAAGELAEVNFADQGLQLSRGTRALKLWMSLKSFGVGAFRSAVDQALDLAREAERRIRTSESLELLAPVTLGIVCFHRRFPGLAEEAVDQINRGLVTALEASGAAAVSTTTLRGRYAIRMCILNPRTTLEDVMGVLEWFERAPQPSLEPEVAGDRDEGEAMGAMRGWLAPPGSLGEALGRLPLLRSLPPEQLAQVTSTATERVAEAGETIVSQWEASREFYVILDGSVEVRADGNHLRELGTGEFFGELAAFDWGASFGYPRLASVIARARTRLVVLPSEELNQLMRDVPAVDRQIRRAMRQRLYAAPQ
jgi:aromatic-L-amino-acid/L-tryptophan decarboxylase